MEAGGMKADGTGATQITDTPTAKTEPTWSPDGTRIAYVANSFDVDGQTDLEIWSINADGTGEVNLTPAGPYGNVTYQGNDDNPDWSPDGSQIAYTHTFAANTSGVPNVWVMDANGANQRPIDTSTAHDISPDWQPDPPACDIGGDAANNTLKGTTADETICGLGGNDKIDGGGGNDILLGGNGNDTLVSAAGRATLSGGPGKDTASFAGSATRVRASLTDEFAQRIGTEPLEGVALLDIENLTGSGFGDDLVGDGGANKLVGGKGADELLGLAGKDTLNSKDGVKRNDTLNGGTGADRCITDLKEKSIKSC